MTGDDGVKERLEKIEAELECVVCMKLLFDPLTLPCGHSFCRLCMIHALDHSPRCPTCRAELLYFDAAAYPPAITLQNVLAALFSEETAARREEDEAVLPPIPRALSGGAGREAGGIGAPGVRTLQSRGGSAASSAGERMTLPLFVLRRVVFPGEVLSLCIFEPRYVLMLQRCLRTSRQFALLHSACVESGSMRSVSRGAVATTLRIESCAQDAAARFLIRTRALYRVRVLSSHLADDYIVGITEKLVDDPSPSPDLPADETHAEPRSTQLDHADAPRSLDRLVADLCAIAGTNSRYLSDAAAGYEQQSLVLSAAMVHDQDARYELLQMTSSRERLEALLRRAADESAAGLTSTSLLRRILPTRVRSCATQ